MAAALSCIASSALSRPEGSAAIGAAVTAAASSASGWSDAGAVVEVKFLRDRVCFNFYVAEPPPQWVLRCEAALTNMGGDPHRGKASTVARGSL